MKLSNNSKEYIKDTCQQSWQNIKSGKKVKELTWCVILDGFLVDTDETHLDYFSYDDFHKNFTLVSNVQYWKPSVEYHEMNRMAGWLCLVKGLSLFEGQTKTSNQEVRGLNMYLQDRIADVDYALTNQLDLPWLN